MRVINDNLLVTPVETRITEHSILTLIKTPEHYMVGEVLSSGDKTKMSWKAGDRVVMHKQNSGVPVEYMGMDCIIISEQQCVARTGTDGVVE